MNSDSKKSLFDSDENGQQILPFDFPEDDEVDVALSKERPRGDDQESESVSRTPEPIDTDRKLENTTDSLEVGVSANDTEPKVHNSEKSSDKVSDDSSSHPAEIAETQKKRVVTEQSGGKSSTVESEKKVAAPSVAVASPSHRPGVQPESTDSREKSKKTSPLKLPAAKKKGDPAKRNPLSKDAGDYPPSQILREARVRSGLSLEQVSQTTKIKEDFIAALEHDDETSFPPKVFVSAYVKQLCKLYKVDPAPVLVGLEKMFSSGDKENKVSEEILQDIDSGKQINMREEERLKRIFKVALISIAAIVLCAFLIRLTWGGDDSENSSEPRTAKLPDAIEDAAPPSDSNASQSPSLQPKELEAFMIHQPTFTMTKLKVPKHDERN